jgi:hypothetical protein
MWERQVSDLQHIYNKLLFDSINEALSKILGPAAEQPPVWLAYNRQPPPLTRPPTGAALVQRVQQLVRKWSERQCGDDQQVPPAHTLSPPPHVETIKGTFTPSQWHVPSSTIIRLASCPGAGKPW